MINIQKECHNEVLVLCHVQNGYINEETSLYFLRIKELVETGCFTTILLIRDYEVDINVPDWMPEDVIVITSARLACVDSFFRFIKHSKRVFIVGFDTEGAVLSNAFTLWDNKIQPIILSDYCYSRKGFRASCAGANVLRLVLGEGSVQWTERLK